MVGRVKCIGKRENLGLDLGVGSGGRAGLDVWVVQFHQSYIVLLT